MIRFLHNIWNDVSRAGLSNGQSKRERNSIVLLNRAWLVLISIQCYCMVMHLVNGILLSAAMTSLFVISLLAVHFLMQMGRVNAGKILAIIAINFNTALMAVFMGEQTHLIDFLLLTALLPLYFFEIKNRRLIYTGIGVSVLLFAIYHIVAPYVTSYALPLDVQTGIYHTTTWVKVLCLATLLYLIYNKNAAYEREVSEKEKDLVGQKRLYESILDQIPIDIITYDQDMKFTYVNTAAISNPETRDWMIGKRNADFFEACKMDPKLAEERERLLKAALDQKKSIEMEESLLTKSGAPKFVVNGVSPVYDKDGESLLSVICYSLDITHIKETEKKLKEYSTELERKNDDLHHFVNATSHDLKSPLRNIASHLQLLEKRNQNNLDAESLSLISHTVKSVKHLNQLIRDIYQYSVADRNDKPLQKTDVNKVIDTTLREMSVLIQRKNANVYHNILPVLKVADTHIHMLFTNLIGNAIKYNTSAQPRVMVGCEPTEHEYIFSVADNGIGIAPEYRKQIFEIFQRLHTASEYEGTGVGLAICSKIADNYGGRIWVESEPGLGSVFYFTLAKALVDPDSEDNLRIFDNRKFAIAS